MQCSVELDYKLIYAAAVTSNRMLITPEGFAAVKKVHSKPSKIQPKNK